MMVWQASPLIRFESVNFTCHVHLTLAASNQDRYVFSERGGKQRKGIIMISWLECLFLKGGKQRKGIINNDFLDYMFVTLYIPYYHVCLATYHNSLIVCEFWKGLEIFLGTIEYYIASVNGESEVYLLKIKKKRKKVALGIRSHHFQKIVRYVVWFPSTLMY